MSMAPVLLGTMAERADAIAAASYPWADIRAESLADTALPAAFSRLRSATSRSGRSCSTTRPSAPCPPPPASTTGPT